MKPKLTALDETGQTWKYFNQFVRNICVGQTRQTAEVVPDTPVMREITWSGLSQDTSLTLRINNFIDFFKIIKCC